MVVKMSHAITTANKNLPIRPSDQEEAIESDAGIPIVHVWNVFDINSWIQQRLVGELKGMSE